MSSNHLAVQRPFFSVVTVCLNAGQGLGDTLRSVCSQSFEDWTVTVKDGLSSDGSLESIPDDSRICIVRQRDSGIYDAMNQGLSRCPGQYVLFLNAGDVLSGKTTLEQVSGAARVNEYPDIVYTDYRSSIQKVPYRSPRQLTRSFLFRNTICHQATYVRRQLFEQIGGFDLDYRVLADYDFLLRAILRAHARAHHIPVVSVHSLHGGYSSRREIRRLAAVEARRLRRRYFGAFWYWVGSALRVVSLPAVRGWIAGSASPAWIRHAYQSTVNRLQQ